MKRSCPGCLVSKYICFYVNVIIFFFILDDSVISDNEIQDPSTTSELVYDEPIEIEDSRVFDAAFNNLPIVPSYFQEKGESSISFSTSSLNNEQINLPIKIEIIQLDSDSEIETSADNSNPKSSETNDPKNETIVRRMRGPYRKKDRPPRNFQCSICPVVSKSNYALDLHVKVVHFKVKEHECKICNSKFGRIGHLKVHETTHYATEKTFKCNICQSMFKSAGSLSMHQKLHRGPSFFCILCKKGFYSNYQIKEHMNSHEGNLNHECTICDKKYVSLPMLKMHLKSHVTMKLECPCCFKQLKSSQALKCHLMKNHSDIDENQFVTLIKYANNLTFDYENLKYVPKY